MTRALVLIALLAALVRVGTEISLRTEGGAAQTLAGHLLGDERAYDAFARDVADGTLQRERAFYQEPLYAWLLGQLYRVWPPASTDPSRSFVTPSGVHEAVFVMQHLLGVAIAVGTALLGARALGRRAGILAGVFAALSGPLVLHETMLLKSTLGLAILLGVLLLWLDLLERGGRRRALLLGLALGVGILLRGNLYLLLLLVVLSLVLPLGMPRRRPLDALLVVVAALLALSPATLHNLSRGDRVLTTYQAGTNAAIGQPDDDDPHAGLVYAPLRAGRGDARFEEEDAVAFAEAATGRRLAGHEVSAWWWDEVRRRVAERPLVAARRALSKLVYTFHGREVGDVKDWGFLSRAVPWLPAPISGLWLIGPWALIGFCVLPWRRRPGLLVVRSGLLVVAASLALFYVMGRYRLSAVPCLWILAAGAVDRGWTILTGPASWAAKALVVGLAVGVPWLQVYDPAGDVGGDHVPLANAAGVERVLAEQAATPAEASVHRDQAVDLARQAVAIAPLFPVARTALVRALAAASPVLEPDRTGAAQAAWGLLLVLEGERTGISPQRPLSGPPEDWPRAAIALLDQPSAPGGEMRAGPLLGYASRVVAQDLRAPEEQLLALRLAERSLTYEPDEPLAFVLAGRALKRLGRLDEALVAYRSAVDAGVDMFEVHNNLGNVLRELGRFDEAVDALERAWALAPDNPVVLRNLEAARAGR